MLQRKKSKRYNFYGRARSLGKTCRLTKSYGYNVKKSESLEKSIFENKIVEDKNNAGEFDEDLNDIGDDYQNDNEMESRSDLSESESSSENSEEDYAIMLDEMPERDELSERSDDEEGKIECGDGIIDIDKECFTFDELEMEDFNFKGLLEELLSEGTTIENRDQNDEKYLLPDHPEISSSTVKTFAIDINAVFSGYNVQESLIDDVFSILQKHLPGVQWPTNFNGTDSNHKKKKVKNSLKQFIVEDERALKFDVCRNGCMSFIGNNFEDIFCSKCNAKRFYPCTSSVCKGLPYRNCGHVNRVSHKVFHYRYLQ